MYPNAVGGTKEDAMAKFFTYEERLKMKNKMHRDELTVFVMLN